MPGDLIYNIPSSDLGTPTSSGANLNGAVSYKNYKNKTLEEEKKYFPSLSFSFSPGARLNHGGNSRLF